MTLPLIIPPVTYKSTVYFIGTDREIEEAERQDERQIKQWAHIFSLDFNYFHFKNSIGQAVVLHRSTRPEAKYQLSFIDFDGVPSRHELYNTPDEIVKACIMANTSRQLTTVYFE